MGDPHDKTCWRQRKKHLGGEDSGDQRVPGGRGRMHKARWRERRAPGGKGGGKRGRGTERDMPPEAATADVCTSVATVGSYAAGSAPRGLGLRPGQSGLRASLASQLRAASVSSSQPTSSSDSVIPVPAWEVARGGLYTLWLDKARSRTDHTARH